MDLLVSVNFYHYNICSLSQKSILELNMSRFYICKICCDTQFWLIFLPAKLRVKNILMM